MERDVELLARDKYNDDASKVSEEDRRRLREGEPLAYVVGWVPYLGLHLELAEAGAKALIPRPETEWWTELLVRHIGERALSVLDLCAGSGAIGLAVLAKCPKVRVAFADCVPDYAALIERNIALNHLDRSRADIHIGDLLKPFPHQSFDLIAANPPYVPESRALPKGVRAYEPRKALYGGPDGLSVIRHIAQNAPHHLRPGGEVWMECDIENVEAAAELFRTFRASRTTIQNDLYGRPRLVLACY